MARSRSQGDEFIEEARKRGERQGKASASWVWDFGRMSTRAFNDLKAAWKRSADSVMDEVNEPEWLSGQWAGESINELLGDLIEEAQDNDLDIEDDILEAYEEGAHDEFWTEVWREAELQLGSYDDEEDEDDEDEDEDEN